MWVPPFRYPRLMGYLLLPAAFRSLSRLSSAPSAKASAPRPFCLTIPAPYSVTEHFFGLCCFFYCCSLFLSSLLWLNRLDVIDFHIYQMHLPLQILLFRICLYDIFNFRYSVFKVRRSFPADMNAFEDISSLCGSLHWGYPQWA